MAGFGLFSSSLIKFLLITLLTIIFSTSKTSSTRILNRKTNTDFIKKSCNSTTYPRLCYSSLSIHASKIQRNPKVLAHAALNVTLATAKSTSAIMLNLSKTHGLRPREAAAMRDCIEELSDSIGQLRRSVYEMSKSVEYDFFMMINNIQTWVSAALTDEVTCSDGFGGRSELNGDLKNFVRELIANIAHLTSNALALVNKYASLQE